MTASVDVAPTEGPRTAASLPKTNILLMIVFVFLTFGIYFPVWFLRRRAALNRLDSPTKIAAWPFLLMLAVGIISVLLALMLPSDAPRTLAQDAWTIVDRAVLILIVFQTFKIKDILQDHIRGPVNATERRFAFETQDLSGIATFFLSIFYLQHVINRDIVAQATTPTA